MALARCSGYDPAAVRRAVCRCIDELPDFRQRCRAAEAVLLKPNLLSSRRPPERHVNTHPAVVQALAETLRADFGCRVSIGDSCGSLTPSSTARALSTSRMDRAARAAGAELYNVDAQPRRTVECDGGRVLRRVTLPSTLDRFDLVISVPKMKTHNLTYLTCAVKNLLGLVPGAGKKRAHLLAPRRDEFAALLCDLYALTRPGAALMDGIVAMEGSGPNNGPLRRMGLVAASVDSCALDAVAARLMAMEPDRIPLLREAAERGLGRVNAAEMEMCGDPADAFAAPDFKQPPAYASDLVLRLLPRRLLRTVFEGFCGVYAGIDQSKCRRCGECARNCPSGAISHDEGRDRYSVNPRRCISCYCCDEVCPFDAILMRRPAFRRAVDGALELAGLRRAGG